MHTYYDTLQGTVKAVDGINFEVDTGETLGMAGESGCGKTTAAVSILRMIHPPGRIASGVIKFRDQEILKMNEDRFARDIRWKKISMVFQGAMNALNPVIRIGDQIVEAIQLHEKDVSKTEAWGRVERLFELVGIDPARARSYSHEFSGGMKQRAVIAMALACNPELVLADEPTTALDVIVQAQVFNVITDLSRKLGLSMILITHDLAALAGLCDRLAIMYAGKLVELADVDTIFRNPAHPYTWGLINAVPDLKGPRRALTGISGAPPDLINPPLGCRFHPRCPYTQEVCRRVIPESMELKRGHFIECHLAEDISLPPLRKRASHTPEGSELPGKAESLVRVEGLKKWFPLKKSFIASLRSREKLFVHAVDGVNFQIYRGESLGLAGESGCGKTTIARLLLRLIEPTGGKVFFEGKEIFALDKRSVREMRRGIQLIFQDPYESLNPRMVVYDIVSEPININRIAKSEEERREMVKRALEDVGIKPAEDFFYRYPHELSGGQRQRVAVARAWVLQPKLLVADEPVSMVDVSLRAEVLNAIFALKEKMDITYLFITHDLALARHVCDRIIVIYRGKIVEMGSTDDVINDPLHPYTIALVSAVPRPEPGYQVKVLAKMEAKPEITPPPGCRFHPRCPHAREKCIIDEPPLLEVRGGRLVACHYAGQLPRETD